MTEARDSRSTSFFVASIFRSSSWVKGTRLTQTIIFKRFPPCKESFKALQNIGQGNQGKELLSPPRIWQNTVIFPRRPEPGHW
jgi:hypothetical protein